MQDSRWGLTRVEQHGRITSLNLLATPLFLNESVVITQKKKWWLELLCDKDMYLLCSRMLHST